MSNLLLHIITQPDNTISNMNTSAENTYEDRPDSVTITVEVSDEGWMYEVHANGVEVDGGLCTTTYENALSMAMDCALSLTRK